MFYVLCFTLDCYKEKNLKTLFDVCSSFGACVLSAIPWSLRAALKTKAQHLAHHCVITNNEKRKHRYAKKELTS